MLGSWFDKDNGKDGAKSDQPRRSYDLYRNQSPSASTRHDFQAGRSSLDIPRPNKRTQPLYSTPHDALLSQLQPTPKIQPSMLSKSDVDHAQPHSFLSGPESNASHSRLDLGMSNTPSMYTSITANLRHGGNQSSIQVPPQTEDHLIDPYDGTSHGVVRPQDVGDSQDDDSPPPRLITDTSGNSGDSMWSHLTRVLDLQSQIAKMHIEMEGIGSNDGKRAKGTPGQFGRSPVPTEESRGPFPASRSRKATMSSISSAESGDKGADEEGVGVGDTDEAEQNKVREEEFAKLADQFEGKKESIRNIMNKLDDLSKALTEFHALQAPQIEIPSSRRSSTGATQATMPKTPIVTVTRDSESRSPLYHASLPPFPTLWTPPKTPFSTTSPNILPQSFSRVEPLQPQHPQPQQPQPHNPALPSVLTSPLEFGGEEHAIVDSPASTLGSLQLHADY